MKKIFTLFSAILFFMVLAFAPKASAANIADIDGNFWAKNEIIEMIKDGVMGLDNSGNFHPYSPVQRAEFTSMLIKVLNQNNLDVVINSPYSDVNQNTMYYNDIMRSEQIGLIYGYPDGTFKPSKQIKKEEVTSVMSHITKDTVYDVSALENFLDADSIPEWAKLAYAKAVKYNLYVNYPNSAAFEPSREITRAETAVLLAKLKAAINNVEDKYKAEDVEKTLGAEHLSIHKKAPSNLVTITNKQKIIEEGNILKVAFTEKFNSKKANVGDTVVFENEKDIITDEGTLLIPSGSKFYASVEDIVLPKLFNKSAAVKLRFNRLDMSNGMSGRLNASVYNTLDGYLKHANIKKLAGYTLGGLVAGGAAGSAIGIPTDEIGTSLAIALPSGAALGFITGLFTKGGNYTAAKGDEVYIYLNESLSIRENL